MFAKWSGNKVKRFGSWEASKQLTKPSNHLVVARGRPFDFVTGARRYVVPKMRWLLPRTCTGGCKVKSYLGRMANSNLKSNSSFSGAHEPMAWRVQYPDLGGEDGKRF